LTDTVLTRLRRESRDARRIRYSAYAITLSTKSVTDDGNLSIFFHISAKTSPRNESRSMVSPDRTPRRPIQKRESRMHNGNVLCESTRATCCAKAHRHRFVRMQRNQYRRHPRGSDRDPLEIQTVKAGRVEFCRGQAANAA
jgi:hypothetical protein